MDWRIMNTALNTTATQVGHHRFPMHARGKQDRHQMSGRFFGAPQSKEDLWCVSIECFYVDSG
jgi:hypothetical protein